MTFGPPRKLIKACTGCGEILPRSAFYIRANGQVIPRCKDCCSAASKTLDRQKRALYKRRSRERHPDSDTNYGRIYKARPEYKRRRLVLLKERKKSDPAFAIANSLRRTLADKVRTAKSGKSGGTFEILGCSIQEFIVYVEGKFAVGMSWANWGRGRGCWHLDHIRPIASFDLTDPVQQRACFHFTNHQPLWWIDNIRKGAKIMCGV